uniref:Uncharacterized protein n=1 Tax=Anguilla anguilla TaxID=7936 RepID=A0A0E9S0R2_ANGAN
MLALIAMKCEMAVARKLDTVVMFYFYAQEPEMSYIIVPYIDNLLVLFYCQC